MLCFPRLFSGAAAQYPVIKRRIQRTAGSRAADGSVLKLLDPGAERIAWELQFSGLSAAERQALESLFEEAEGKLGEFTFLDPTDNLLRWSEDLSRDVWVRDPLIQLTAGVSDPEGTNTASRLVNSGAVEQALRQTIQGPGGFQYCLSLYVRSAQPVQATVFAAAGGAEEQNVVAVTPAWRRVLHSTRLDATAEAVDFGVVLAAGASVEFYGMQVEAQPGASPYRKTLGRSGVHARCRFADDRLSMTAEGPEQYSCRVRLATVESE